MTATYDDPLTAQPSIIGIYQNELVASPSDFPEPNMITCICDYIDVGMPESNDHESGLCLISNLHCYQMEETVFKLSLYGSIHRGWVLHKSTSSPTSYHRLCHEFEIIVKKFRKIDVEMLSKADDPLQEFSALQYLGNDHPHVLGQIACLHDNEYYYSVMKYVDGGELCSRILGVGPVNENRAREMFLQLLDALEYIQSKGIFHRDISLENILMTKSGQLMLIDFGMCLQIPIQDSSAPYLLPPMSAKGKKSYMAPEIVSESAPFNGFKSDIWSLGIVLFTMLTGKFIVTHASPLCQLFRHVRNGRLKEMCVHWKLGLSEDVQCLLYDMLSVDAKKRPTISEIRKYSWCKAPGIDEIDGGLTVAGA